MNFLRAFGLLKLVKMKFVKSGLANVCGIRNLHRCVACFGIHTRYTFRSQFTYRLHDCMQTTQHQYMCSWLDLGRDD